MPVYAISDMYHICHLTTPCDYRNLPRSESCAEANSVSRGKLQAMRTFRCVTSILHAASFPQRSRIR